MEGRRGETPGLTESGPPGTFLHFDSDRFPMEDCRGLEWSRFNLIPGVLLGSRWRREPGLDPPGPVTLFLGWWTRPRDLWGDGLGVHRTDLPLGPKVGWSTTHGDPRRHLSELGVRIVTSPSRGSPLPVGGHGGTSREWTPPIMNPWGRKPCGSGWTRGDLLDEEGLQPDERRSINCYS